MNETPIIHKKQTTGVLYEPRRALFDLKNHEGARLNSDLYDKYLNNDATKPIQEMDPARI